MQELDLAPPGPGEVLVRLVASGVCRSDYNAIDGTTESPCPVVLGHEGAGVVEAVGAGVTRVAPGDHVALSWTPSCGECSECVRDLPQLCSTVWPVMNEAGLMDGTSRLSRDGERVYHYCFLSTFAEATRRSRALVRPDPARRSVRRRGPRRLRDHDRRGRRLEDGGRAAGRPGRRDRLWRRRPLRADGGGRRRSGARDRGRHDAEQGRRGEGVRRIRGCRLGGERRRRLRRRFGRSAVGESTTRSRRPGAARQCRPPSSRPAIAAPRS